jgi:hypothetical protein
MNQITAYNLLEKIITGEKPIFYKPDLYVELTKENSKKEVFIIQSF